MADSSARGRSIRRAKLVAAERILLIYVALEGKFFFTIFHNFRHETVMP
jgi:hypothetical protein